MLPNTLALCKSHHQPDIILQWRKNVYKWKHWNTLHDILSSWNPLSWKPYTHISCTINNVVIDGLTMLETGPARCICKVPLCPKPQTIKTIIQKHNYHPPSQYGAAILTQWLHWSSFHLIITGGIKICNVNSFQYFQWLWRSSCDDWWVCGCDHQDRRYE